MKGRGLFLVISQLLYDAALADSFVSTEEMSGFLDETPSDVVATIEVLHNVMVAVTYDEYTEVLNKVLTSMGKHRQEIEQILERCCSKSNASKFTLNPIVSSLIEKGIGPTPIYEALKLVVSGLLEQWESAAREGKLTEFTSRLSSDHRAGMVIEISRRYVLRETCALTEEEKTRIRESPFTLEKFKRIAVSKFMKAYEMGTRVNVHITPSDVISYVSAQIKREGFPG